MLALILSALVTHRRCLPLLLLAACGPSGKAGPTGHVEPSDRACPPAAAVRIAFWQSPVAYGGDGDDNPQAPRWRVPLRLYGQTYDDRGEVTSTRQPPGPRTEAEVRTAIDGPLGADAWIYGNGATEPCQGRVVGYDVAAIHGAADDYDLLTAQVVGCAPRGDAKHMSFAVLGVDPAGCSLAVPEVVSSRDGSYPEVDDDQQRVYQLPDGPDQLPAEIAGVVTPPACAAPPCRPLWQVRRAGGAGQYVYDANVMWLSPVAAGDECSWITSESRRLYLGGEVAVSTAQVMVDGTDRATGAPAREEVTVELEGVLHDAGGARLMLTSRPGAYGVHELDGDRLGAGAMRDWYVPHDGDYIGSQVGPSCGL